MNARAVVNLARLLSRVVLEHAERAAEPAAIESFLHVANLLELAARELEILAGLKERPIPPCNAPSSGGMS